MKAKTTSFWKLCVAATLIGSIFLSTNSCKKELRLIPIGEAKVVRQLENGNWEVTPAFVYEYRKMKKELEN